MGIKATIVKEFKEILMVTLYFFVAFGFIAVLRMLILAQNDIEFYRTTGAIIGALTMGKLIPLLDKTKLANLLTTYPMYKGVLIKTIIYSLIADFIILLEHVYHLYASDKIHGNLVRQLIEERDMSQVWLVGLSSFFILLNYNLFIRLGVHFKERKLLKLFFKSDPNQN